MMDETAPPGGALFDLKQTTPTDYLQSFASGLSSVSSCPKRLRGTSGLALRGDRLDQALLRRIRTLAMKT